MRNFAAYSITFIGLCLLVIFTFDSFIMPSYVRMNSGRYMVNVIDRKFDYAENILRHQKLKISSELKENKLETAKILRENKAKLSKELFTLSKLVKSGSINEVIDFLHDELNKDEVNEVNDVGSTPSHFAAQRGDEKILEFLFKNGANLNVRNKYSHTPLDMSFNQASANLIRRHGGKTGEELKAEGK